MKKSIVALAALAAASAAFAQTGFVSFTPVHVICKDGRAAALEFEALHAGTVTITLPEQNPCTGNETAKAPAAGASKALPKASRPKLPERQPVPNPRPPTT